MNVCYVQHVCTVEKDDFRTDVSGAAINHGSADANVASASIFNAKAIIFTKDHMFPKSERSKPVSMRLTVTDLTSIESKTQVGRVDRPILSVYCPTRRQRKLLRSLDSKKKMLKTAKNKINRN